MQSPCDETYCAVALERMCNRCMNREMGDPDPGDNGALGEMDWDTDEEGRGDVDAFVVPLWWAERAGLFWYSGGEEVNGDRDGWRSDREEEEEESCE